MAQEIDSASWTGRPKQRINTMVATSMVAVALCLDGLQTLMFFLNGIPAVGTVIDFVVSTFISFTAAAIFGIWFALLGVKYFSGKNAAKKTLIVMSSFIVELIPLIDALPAITFGVVAVIVQTYAEDKSITGKDLAKTLVSVGKVAAKGGTLPALSATRSLLRDKNGDPAEKESYASRKARFDARRTLPAKTPPAVAPANGNEETYKEAA